MRSAPCDPGNGTYGRCCEHPPAATRRKIRKRRYRRRQKSIKRRGPKPSEPAEWTSGDAKSHAVKGAKRTESEWYLLRNVRSELRFTGSHLSAEGVGTDAP